MRSSELFAPTKKHLLEANKMRGENKKRYLEELEFMRTHRFKRWGKTSRKSGEGRWIKR